MDYNKANPATKHKERNQMVFWTQKNKVNKPYADRRNGNVDPVIKIVVLLIAGLIVSLNLAASLIGHH